MPVGRRRFISILGGTALAWPRALEGLERRLTEIGDTDSQDFWDVVRSGFLIPEDRIYLNAGTLGPSPRVVVEAVEEHARRVAATYPPGVDWDDLKTALGGFLDADYEGFVLPRNTTEAMSFVAHGLELGRGDEVVLTDHEHVGGKSAWELIAARWGAELRIARLPVPAVSAQEIVDAIWDVVGPRTRLVVVSHVTFTNGTTIPVPELARRCNDRGMVLVVDGAHPPGMLQVSLRALGGDFYASSPHKWLLAPQGTGLLYLAERWRNELWPTLASGGWDDRSLGAQRFNHLGTLDESRLAGLLAALEYQRAIGSEAIERRVRELHQRLRASLEQIPALELVTPRAPELSSAILSFRVQGVDSLDLQGHLVSEANVRTRVIGEYDLGWMRLSTHIFNTPAELDRVAELIDDAARRGVGA